jgi:Ca2+-transporting ATPase
VRLARSIQQQGIIVAYVRYQMTQLLALVLLFVAATAIDINQGVALAPSMVLYLFFCATALGVVIIAVDPGDPDAMHRPPRDPRVPITNRTAVLLWLLYASVLFAAALVPLVAGPDEPRTDAASSAMTMPFVVLGLGTVGNAVTNRRGPAGGLAPPILKALTIGLIPVGLVLLATEVDFLQQSLLTRPLTGTQWLACIALAAALPMVVEVVKGIRRARAPRPLVDARQVVAPARARTADDRAHGRSSALT